ncbi:MAG: hypothetical protein F6K30_03125 [Cyanothece sp. SIO2G6]|nr:hypothetical protein [Cyanothece sp. SIO2G6]
MSEQQDIIAEILKDFSGKLSEDGEKKSYGEDDLVELKRACDSFLKKEVFKVGQIVKWKTNLKNRKFPHQNQPAIVVQVLDEPIVSPDEEPGSPYFLEKLDIVLGVMTQDSVFLTFYYDSSRFEFYQV